MSIYHLECFSCGKTHEESESYTTCLSCGAPLTTSYDYEAVAERLNLQALKTMPLKAAKYLDFYPILDRRKMISLDEGGTPLYHCKNLGKHLGLKHLYLKHEGANPTGVFKDRGTMVEITKALELGKKAVVVASTGNMAASVSAYCAKANLPCYVLVPQGTPIGKLAQTLAYGARIIQIRGTYDQAAKITEQISKKHNFYLAGDYAYRLEGNKSEAYEIVEQLGWQAPDKLFVPVGCGTHGSAIWKGFKEYRRFGMIDTLPQMIAVQASGANTVVKAFNSHAKITPVDNPATVASAICIGYPSDGLKIMEALKESKGHGVVVDDNEILEAQKMLSRMESIFVEPSSATTLAALVKMVAEGTIEKHEKIVLAITAVGLKDPVSALKVLYSPPVVEPDVEEVEQYLNYGFYDVVASPSHQKEVLFKKQPSLSDLGKTIQKVFHTELSKQDLETCNTLIGEFVERGKEILKGDLQYILEKTIRSSAANNGPLKVLDYTISTGKHNNAQATVKILCNGEEIESTAKGVGPVDAPISAIRKVLTQNGFSFALTDYNVSITEGGANASVNVKMTLEDEKRNKIIGMGTSPDIIAASIEAFEEGYNLLYLKNKKSSS